MNRNIFVRIPTQEACTCHGAKDTCPACTAYKKTYRIKIGKLGFVTWVSPGSVGEIGAQDRKPVRIAPTTGTLRPNRADPDRETILKILHAWQQEHGRMVRGDSWHGKAHERPSISRDRVYKVFHSMKAVYRAMYDCGMISWAECQGALEAMRGRKRSYDMPSHMKRP